MGHADHVNLSVDQCFLFVQWKKLYKLDTIRHFQGNRRPRATARHMCWHTWWLAWLVLWCSAKALSNQSENETLAAWMKHLGTFWVKGADLIYFFVS